MLIASCPCRLRHSRHWLIALTNMFSYYLHLPLETFKMCARTTGHIFTVPTATDIFSDTAMSSYHSLSLSILYTVITPPATPSFRLILHSHCHSSVITPHCHSVFRSICCLILSTHLLILERGLSTHYFSNQLGMIWSSHINLIGKLE